MPNGTKVLPIGGDPVGGGNSDGFAASKDCYGRSTALINNWCPNNIFKNNVVFGNADDGVDISLADSILQGNIIFKNGPEGNTGVKFLSRLHNITLDSNIVAFNLGIGFDIRANISREKDINLHNIAFNNSNRGISGLPDNAIVKNNLGAYNFGIDIAGTCANCTNNWAEDTNGDPQIINKDFVIDTNFNSGMNISDRLEHIRNQFRIALAPASINSPLVDAGVKIDGYHCNTVGEVGNCRTWYGAAPDIGAYEYNPGIQTGCITRSELNNEIQKFVNAQIGIVDVTNKVVEYLGC